MTNFFVIKAYKIYTNIHEKNVKKVIDENAYTTKYVFKYIDVFFILG